MVNPNTIYSVTGRYMDGQKLIGYHLVGEDGSQAQVSKEQVIWLIGKGAISNMRLQIGANKEIIIRGKGVNLNNLPVFDQGKQQFRNTDASQAAANSKVSVARSNVSDANPMGQYKILKRIMYKNNCLGYEVVDHSGKVSRKKREKVIELAIQKLISNAVARKYTRPGKVAPEIILRGVDCDLNRLPILIVDNTGKIVDPTLENNQLTVRSAYMKRSGLVKDNVHNKDIPFKAGDFIVCGANGEITIKNKLEMEKEYTKSNDESHAICDDYLYFASNYFIEIFGGKPIQITDNMIKAWAIFKPRMA